MAMSWLVSPIMTVEAMSAPQAVMAARSMAGSGLPGPSSAQWLDRNRWLHSGRARLRATPRRFWPVANDSRQPSRFSRRSVCITPG